jgi:hypothetical protein
MWHFENHKIIQILILYKIIFMDEHHTFKDLFLASFTILHIYCCQCERTSIEFYIYIK